MPKPETILAASDLSENSAVALKRAAILARQNGARLELLHVVEDLPQEAIPAPLRVLVTASSLQQLTEAALKKLEQQAERAVGREIACHCRVETGKDFVAIIHGGRQVERHFGHEHPGALIPQLAKKLATDLLAMGTAGRSGLPYILLGSVAEHALREAPCDVLTVRPAGFSFELP
jgi:nucleotide-binding universal stress UspA family protein